MIEDINWTEIQKHLQMRMVAVSSKFRDNPSVSIEFAHRPIGFFDRDLSVTMRGTFDAATIAEVGLIALEHGTWVDIKNGHIEPLERLYDDDGNVLPRG